MSREFIAGRRTKYMHPLRLYIIISFFYFLMFSFFISNQVEDERILNFKTTNNNGGQNKTLLEASHQVNSETQSTLAIDSSREH
ncbi:MAG: DUF3667 domain-containing protein [Bacteroidota bacterium]|nr:DUF3667 domain-containing protein [Bacteroidota bacterium]